MVNDIGTSFGQWVKRRRKSLDLTQAALAEQVGCSIATIEKIEADQRRPSRQIASILADVLEISPDELDVFIRVARGERSLERLEGIPSVSVKPRKINLPAPTTTLVGRQAELGEMSRLLKNPDCRLLTLVGAGGIGKTRLSMAFILSLWSG
jgi:transcriptional regulator with XRE-family HTH domain